MTHKTLFYCLAILCFVNKIEGDLIVNTNSGRVEGREVPSILRDEKYYSFAGIPYAKPPVGSLRFMPPEPHPGWEDVLDAKKEKKQCAQTHFKRSFSGDEDCLNLSIYTPKLPRPGDSNLPVIVFLYSEHFQSSYNASKDYGPDFFMNEDVIVVNIHHRLGALGFLSFEDDLLPGNNGLRDVILALKWIKENIKHFGGNPNRVTLMGSQTGGVLAEILLHSPKAKGLFNAAIIQSGTLWSSMYFNGKAREKAIEYSKALEVESATSSFLLKMLADIPAKKLAESETYAVHADEARSIQRGVHPFGPVIEHDHPDAVITDLPDNKPVDFDVPVMIGFNSREAIEMTERYLQKPQYLTFADRDFLMLFPIRVGYHFKINDNIYAHAIQDIKEHYFEEGYIKISKPGEYLSYIGDVTSIYPTDYAVRKYTNSSSNSIFYYMFDYSGELNMKKKNSLENALNIDGAWGATVGDELCYMFVCNGIRKSYKKALKDEDSEEMKVLKNMVRLWTNFAKTGNPTPPGEEFTWKPATSEKKECLVITDELTLVPRLYHDMVQFWDDWIAKYRELAIDGLVYDVKDELCNTDIFKLVNFVFLSLIVICYGDNVEVILKQGVLSGTVDKTFLKQRNYNAFRAIPYAEPPVGALRFLPPKPHQGWDGKYEAHTNKPTCMQFNSRGRNNEPFGISGSEDCLHLSVFTPSLQGSFPVVVFDYNDQFRTSFNTTDTYSPDFFLEEDVIVVMVNHRLDVFGYLTTEDAVIPPNAGLKDFILALEWIKENIVQFGGDPKRVTLMGSRGGATLIHILLYSEKAKGLFSSAILQSGTALGPGFFSDKTKKKAFQLGEELDIKTEDSHTLLKHLQTIDTEEMFYKQANILSDDDFLIRQVSVYPFAPIIEADNPDAVITSLPENTKIVNDVPVIIGLNSREGLDLVAHYIFEPRLLVETTKDYFIHFPIRSGFRFDRNSSVFQKVEQEIKDFYLEDGYLHPGNILEYSVYVGDIMQNYAVEYTVSKLRNELSSSLYYYMFDFRGELNENSVDMSKRARSSMKNWGATIGDELCYLHMCTRIKKTYESLTNLVSEQPEIKLLKKTVRMWTNFIKTGNPTQEEKNDNIIRTIRWDPVNKNTNKHHYLHINKSPKMKDGPLGNRAEFWDDFLKKYSEMAVDGLVTDPDAHHDEL